MIALLLQGRKRLLAMSVVLAPVLAGLLSTSFYPKASESFRDSDYAKHTYKSFAALPAAKQAIDADNIDYDLLNASIFFATNRQRVLNNRKVLQFSPEGRDAAKLQSQQMVTYNFFAHQNPKNAALRTLKDRLKSVAGTKEFLSAGENLAEYFLLDYVAKETYSIEYQGSKKVFIRSKTGKEIKPHTYVSFGEAIVADWMTSPGHRANILEAAFTHLGCGTLLSTKPDAFPKAKATQVFCTPKTN
jgi:uncharacterized protein YkwD